MNNSAKIIATICLAAAAAMAIPPMLSSLGAGRAQPVKAAAIGDAQAAAWEFQPMTAGMSAAVRANKKHV
jgi:hypothetical protein